MPAELEQKDLEDSVVSIALGKLQTNDTAHWFEDYAHEA